MNLRVKLLAKILLWIPLSTISFLRHINYMSYNRVETIQLYYLQFSIASLGFSICLYFIAQFVKNYQGSTSSTCSRKAFMHAGVNFTNILWPAFALADPESTKKIDNLTVFFTLLGSESPKAVPRTLMKLSPDPQNAKWLMPYCEQLALPVPETRSKG